MPEPRRNAAIELTRRILVPDPVKAARSAQAPDLGPRILFFSGGSALRDTAARLTAYTSNSIHVITPFDSGGSSAKLRQAFHMPAIGDMRYRIMALADQTLRGNPEVVALFAHRLPKDADRPALLAELDAMAAGDHRLVASIPDPMRKIIRNHLYDFLRAMPGDFDLRGASLGNLVLTAGYLANRRQLDPVLYIFSQLVQARGVVRPVVNKHLHLTARLADGSLTPRQHQLTGKECGPIASKVADVWLSAPDEPETPVDVDIRDKTVRLIASADLICYPIGSFYSSVAANLLPRGVGRAVAANPCPKVYIPNPGPDPETPGCSVGELAETLVRYARRHDPELAPTDLLDLVLVDTRGGTYPGGLEPERIQALGARVLDLDLTAPSGGPAGENAPPRMDPDRLARVLISLA
ncbi:MAG: GAK system CofD-like protein [Desulfovibrionaceae bacterium]